MSPVRSIRHAPSRLRTLAWSSLVVIWASLQAQGELDGVSARLARHARLVNHLLDQEQAPAARLLATLELRLKVRGLGFWQLAGVAAVGHLNEHALRGEQYADRYRPIGAVLVAVLHRVHRGLGNRRLQALDARGLEAQVGDRTLHALDHAALVAGLARQLEVGQDAAVGRCGNVARAGG